MDPAMAGDTGIPVLNLDRLERRYGEQQALAGISLSVAPGEFFTLLGPSGCGKSTTLRLIGGFEQPSAGRIWLQGRDVTGLPPQRRPVNTVFQQYALFPHLSVWENVAFGPRSRGLARAELRQRVGEMLEIVGLSGLAGQRPRQLSGGQQQRVALARALVNTPALLLLDEPLAALDASLRRTMQSELKRIQREVGVAFLMVSHDQQEVLGMSDRLAVLRAGRIEQIGSPTAIYERPANAFVAAFVGQANLLAGADGAGGSADEAGGSAGGGDLLMIRPERIRLGEMPPQAGELGCEGRVSAITFEGSHWRVELRSRRADTITAVLNSAALPEAIRSGASLWAVWDERACHRLPAAATDTPHPPVTPPR
jgi:spermidine/putrescine transport system ATP-binding protein